MSETLDGRKADLELRLAELNIAKAEFDLLDKMEAREDKDSRVFAFRGEVEQDRVGEAMDWLDRMVQKADQPACISFSSFGGSVMDGLALFDEMLAARACGLELVTRCSGYTASMASVLMQAGTHRVATPHAWFHVHEPATGMRGKTSDFRDEAKVMEDLWDQMLDIFAERSGRRAADLRERFERRERWLKPSEALSLGLIDQVEDSNG